MTPQVHEKRRETRRKAEGAVHVSVSGPPLLQIEGRLMDLSASGFRMAHGCVSLAAGQTVEFSHTEGMGSARVMWNRVVAGQVESGFLVVG